MSSEMRRGTRTTVVTVAVGDYEAGAVALINSLAHSGFSGTILVAYQGAMGLRVAPGSPVSTIELPRHANTMPFNLKATALGHVKSGDVIYIDADCVVTGPRLMNVVNEALNEAPVFSAEGILPASDVRVLAWRRVLGASSDWKSNVAIDCFAYVNSGFMAFRMPRDAQYLSRWQEFMNTALTGRGDFFETPYFALPDQDCLNATIRSLGEKVATLGPPDVWYRGLPSHPFVFMGIGLDPMLLHCTGISKPWRLRQPPLARPDIYDKEFYRFAYVETPWATLNKPLPASVVRWIEDGVLSKASLKVRKASARLSQVARTLAGSG